MKIAILSDVHENSHNLILAFNEMKDRNIEQVVFLGDLINNGIAKIFVASPVPVFALWGNNDGDKVTILKTSFTENSNLTMSGSIYDFLEFDGKKIFATHYPDLAKPMAKSGIYDAVFCGHDHTKLEDKIGDCLVINPGEISAHKTKISSFAIYDTKEHSAEFVDIDDSITLRTEIVEEYNKKIGFKFSKSKRHEY